MTAIRQATVLAMVGSICLVSTVAMAAPRTVRFREPANNKVQQAPQTTRASATTARPSRSIYTNQTSTRTPLTTRTSATTVRPRVPKHTTLPAPKLTRAAIRTKPFYATPKGKAGLILGGAAIVGGAILGANALAGN